MSKKLWRYVSIDKSEEKSISPSELIRLIESKRGTVPNDYVVAGLSVDKFYIVFSLEKSLEDEAFLDRLEIMWFLDGIINLSRCIHMGSARR